MYFQISSHLKTEVHSVKAREFAKKLTHLIIPHYDLASTTVTGIPMKEEQNASSSANYDVEIFHSKNAHSVILSTELALPTSIKQGSQYETVGLRLCCFCQFLLMLSLSGNIKMVYTTRWCIRHATMLGSTQNNSSGCNLKAELMLN